MKHFILWVVIALNFAAFSSESLAATKAQSISFLLSQVRTSTTSLAGGKVWAYAAGGTTPKSIWLDKDKQTLAANPYTLDANGTAQLFADGVYRIVIKDSAGVTKFDRDGLPFQDLSANGMANVLDYGTGTLAEAITAIGSTPKTLAYGTDQTLSANVSIPATLELMPLNGAVINHGAYTISYAGSTSKFPDSQVFNGTGDVTGLKESHIDWFATNTTPGTTDMLAAFNAATSSLVIGGNLYLPADNLLISGKWTVNKTINVYGHGQISSTTVPTQILKKSTVTTDAIAITAINVTMNDFLVNGQGGNTGDGVHILANGVTLNRVGVYNQGGNGFRIGSDTTGNNSNSWTMNGCRAISNIGDGRYIHDFDVNANSGTSINFQSLLNGGHGDHLGKAQVNTFVGDLREQNTGWGIYVSPSANLSGWNTFTGGDSEANTAGDIYLNATAFLNYVAVPNAVTVDNGVSNVIVNPALIKSVNGVFADLQANSGDTALATWIKMYQPNTNANNRNWGMGVVTTGYGDFGLFKSAAQGGDPASGGTPMLYFEPSGGAARFGYGVPNNANGNNGDFFFRADGGVGSCVYQKRAGVWAAVL